MKKGEAGTKVWLKALDFRSTPAHFSAYMTPEVNSCEEIQDKHWSRLQLKYKIANQKIPEDTLS